MQTARKQRNSLTCLRASSPIWASEASLARTRQRGAEERREIVGSSPSSAPRGFAARSRVLARLVSLTQIGELARRLFTNKNGRQEIEFETFAKPLDVRISLVLKQTKNDNDDIYSNDSF